MYRISRGGGVEKGGAKKKEYGKEAGDAGFFPPRRSCAALNRATPLTASYLFQPRAPWRPLSSRCIGVCLREGLEAIIIMK